MLRRFECIKDSGIFQDFRWDAAVPDLARINVIFGRNGTGKTSLSRALDGLRNAEDSQGFKRVSLAFCDGSGTRSTEFVDDPAFDRIHVFGDQYVARSHQFTPAGAEMDAVLTVGERPVDAELRLEKLRSLVRKKSEERDKARQGVSDARQATEAVYKQVSQQVVDAASRAGGRWHSRSNFSAGVVRNAVSGSHREWVALSEETLREKIGIINSDKLDSLPETSLLVAVPSGLHERLVNAFASTPSSLILDTLATHPEATSWVDEGRMLHRDADLCIYCGSNLSADRRGLIDQHFSQEVERLQASLKNIISELVAVGQRVDAALTAIPNRGLFFEDLRARYDDAVEDLRFELIALKRWAEGSRTRAEAKAENVLRAVDCVLESPPAVESETLVNLRDEHNTRVGSHAACVKSAAESVERHYLKQAERAVNENSRIEAARRKEFKELQQELDEYDATITALEDVGGDPIPSAKVLTEEVARLLGRSELHFEAVDGRYRVLRFGEPAVGLSAGERTAITLVHFLETVARCDVTNGKPIVVIDDPVSSLDSDVFMGVSTYIWNEAVVKDHIEQLILLTHNFELLRQWDIQVDGLRRGKDSKMGKKLSELYPARFLEIRSRHSKIGGKQKRCPILAPWPPSEKSRRKVRSSYHHAFIVVAETLQRLRIDDSLEARLDAQLLCPNVVRRLLETFLAFKRPEWVGDFNGAMRESATLLVESGYRGDAHALRLRLTRYAHAYSHEEDPSTDKTTSPDEIATAILSVFEFMNQLDGQHFEGLCRAAGFDPKDLLPTPLCEFEEPLIDAQV